MTRTTERGRARVLRALVSFRSTAKASGADLEFLDAYDEILAQLQSGASHVTVSGKPSHVDPLLQPKRVITLTPQAVERIVAQEGTSRKQLEAIAVNRFEIPKGSLRSWSTIDQLREKILTMARNERAHQTIARLAREPRVRRKEDP